MKKFGMVGWGFATKITPQRKEYSSMMTWIHIMIFQM